MAWVTPRTWATSEALTAAKMNEISSSLNVVGSAWTGYSPTWTSTGTPPTMGATSVSGSYRLAGKTVDIHILATVGAGFAAGTLLYRFTLPAGVTPVRTTSHDSIGTCIVWDASASAAYPLHVMQANSTQVTCITPTPTGMGPTVPITWATGDTISIHITALEVV